MKLQMASTGSLSRPTTIIILCSLLCTKYLTIIQIYHTDLIHKKVLKSEFYRLSG